MCCLVGVPLRKLVPTKSADTPGGPTVNQSIWALDFFGCRRRSLGEGLEVRVLPFPWKR